MPMKRRRHFWGDPNRGPAADRQMAPGPLQVLRRANRLMEVGQHSQAAGLFERIAFGARDLGMVRRAPLLFFQGARAYLLSGNTQAGSDLLWQGLKLLAEEKRWHQLGRSGARIVDELQRMGHGSLGDEVSAWVEKTLENQEAGSDEFEYAGREDIVRGSLPVNCGNCGAVLLPDEVEWIDSVSVECPYCGSIIRTVS